MRTLCLFAIVCSWCTTVFAWRDCPITFPSVVQDSKEAHPIRLPSCSEHLPDYSEIVNEIRSSLMSEQTFLRPKLELERSPWLALYKQFFAEGAVQPWSGMEGLKPTVAVYLAEGVYSGQLNKEDATALQTLHKRGFLHGSTRVEDGNFCTLTYVGCTQIGDELRVTALAMNFQRLTKKVLIALSSFDELRGLAAIIEKNQIPDAALDSMNWPKLEALDLFFNAKVDRSLQRLLSEVPERHSKLRSLYIQPGGYDEFNFDMSAYCKLTELRQLLLNNMNIRVIPDCIGALTELRILDMRSSFLTKAPHVLSKLSELRYIVAFRQGEYTPCHLKDPSEGGPPSLKDYEKYRSTDGECKAIFESKVDQDDTDDARVLCPWMSMQGTLQDWMDLGLPKLEKLWLDGGFISGPLPETLPEVWPHMTSLDLYSNEVTGNIPESWTRVRWQKLQLQDNHLSGPVPAGLFDTHCCHFNVVLNEGLTGCIPASVLAETHLGELHMRGSTTLAGTNLKLGNCSSEHHEEL